MSDTTTLAELAVAYPAAARVFYANRLDFCCGGRRPFAEACRERGLDAHALLDEILGEAPIPSRIVTTDGHLLMTRDSILTGQEVWQSTGGQQLGSIWGHGAYQAPDWSADWLHRESLALLDVWARAEGSTVFAALDPERQVATSAHPNGCRLRTGQLGGRPEPYTEKAP